jgi:hypothetical protein
VSDIRYAHLWRVWGFPEDAGWDGETFQVGYMTDSGHGSCVADGLSRENAEFLIEVVREYLKVRLYEPLDRKNPND